MRKKGKYIALLLATSLILSGCATKDSDTTSTSSTQDSTASSETSTSQASATLNATMTGSYSDKALDSSYDESSATKITLDGEAIKVDGDGVKVSGSDATITEKGTYIVSGTLKNGQILVDLTTDNNVQLVLDDANITNEDGPAVYVKSVKNLYLTLADNSKNTLSDGSSYAEDEENPNAVIYSKSDLICNGKGALAVHAKYKDGITSKDDLTIVEGDITVEAADDGIVGKDSVTIKDASLTVNASGDSIKSSNTTDNTKGYVIVDGGILSLISGDDGIHSETSLVVNGGTVDVKESAEGLEGLNIVVNDGTISLVSSDDGFNVSGGVDTNSTDSPTGHGRGMDSVIDGTLMINGGDVTINAEGDGLDSNGNIQMTGGNVTVLGPTNGGNGALDYNGTFEISGGVLLAYGSAGMDQAPSEDSTISFLATDVSNFSSGSKMTIKNSDGDSIGTYTLEKQGSYIVFASSKLTKGDTYTLDVDGNTSEVVAGESSGISTGNGGRGGGWKHTS